LERTNEAVRNSRAFAQAGETEHTLVCADTKRTHLVSNNPRFSKGDANVHVKLHDWSNEEIAVGLRDGRLSVALIARAWSVAHFVISVLKNWYASMFGWRSRRTIHLHDVVPSRWLMPRRNHSLGLTREDFPDYQRVSRQPVRFGKKQARVIQEHDGMTSVVSAVEAGPVCRCAGSAWLRFRQSREASATHSRAKTNLLRHRRAQGRVTPATEKFWQCAKGRGRVNRSLSKK